MTIEQLKKLIIYSILMCTGIFLSIYMKNENVWDFANYHYYNAFAFLNDRSTLDTVPATINTFFNPIIDIPLYFYIEYFNDYPNIIFALQGIWCGLFLLILYKICILFFENNTNGMRQSLLVVLLTVTGQATLKQIGSSANEITVSFFILWGFYILFKMIKFPSEQALTKFLLAGFIMGIGLGLKQTVVIYCVASGLTLIICYQYLNKPFKSIFFFALGGLISYLIINGYFMYQYWVLYGNPFFPFFNGIFNSPYFFDFNYRDAKFIPSALEFFIFPFTWNINPYAIAEMPYYDIRLTLYYVLLISIFIKLILNKKFIHFYTQKKLLTIVYIFTCLSFLIWMGLFSIMRYTIIIEATGSLLLIYLFSHLKNKILQVLKFIIVSVLVLNSYFYSSWGYIKGPKYIDMMNISLPENTLIKIYGPPSSFIIPILSKNQNFKTVSYMPKCTRENKLCINGKGSDFIEYGPFLENRNKIEQEHVGPIIYIYDKFHMDVFQTKSQVIENYRQRFNLCNRAIKKRLFKNKYQCLNMPVAKYKNDIEIAEKYIPYEDIVFNYTCKYLHNSINHNIKICVPKKLKTQILGE